MSFSKAEKNEIINQGEKNLCCKRAFLSGAFASRAHLNSREVEISIDGEEAIAYVSPLIEEI
jgi:DNA-binding transcriptional regulator WhiA